MSKIRILYNNDGGIFVIHPAPKSQHGDTEDVWLKRVFDKATPEGIEYEDIDSSELPSREYRNAWTKNKGESIKIDTAKKLKIDEDKIIAEEYSKILKEQVKQELIKQGKL